MLNLQIISLVIKGVAITCLTWVPRNFDNQSSLCSQPLLVDLELTKEQQQALLTIRLNNNARIFEYMTQSECQQLVCFLVRSRDIGFAIDAMHFSVQNLHVLTGILEIFCNQIYHILTQEQKIRLERKIEDWIKCRMLTFYGCDVRNHLYTLD